MDTRCGSVMVLCWTLSTNGEPGMSKPNYAFAKRQRDLAKKRKKEEKQQRKATTPPTPSSTEQSTATVDQTPRS